MNLSQLQRTNSLWQGSDHALHRPGPCIAASGNADLDAALPGRGWPLGCLVELLAARRGIGEVELLLPALSELSQAGRWVVWVAPPFVPYAPALCNSEVALSRVLVVTAATPRDVLWAAEQVLRAGAVALCWLAKSEFGNLRRLQLAAENGASVAFLFRPAYTAAQPSPAALRLRLEPAYGKLIVRLLKCRGGGSGTPVLPIERKHVVV